MATAFATRTAFSTKPVHGNRCQRRAARTVCMAQASDAASSCSRRQMAQQMAAMAAAALLVGQPLQAEATSMPPQSIKVLCDAECSTQLDALETVTTPSGLQYKDIVKGNGPNPPVGFQVVAHYVAMTPSLRVFDSSLEKGSPYDIRVGAGLVIPGLDEGIRSMQPGGLRRLYIPGNLAFPKGLKAAAGRPSVPAASPVVFDVQLLYIPGLEVEE